MGSNLAARFRVLDGPTSTVDSWLMDCRMSLLTDPTSESAPNGGWRGSSAACIGLRANYGGQGPELITPRRGVWILRQAGARGDCGG